MTSMCTHAASPSVGNSAAVPFDADMLRIWNTCRDAVCQFLFNPSPEIKAIQSNRIPRSSQKESHHTGIDEKMKFGRGAPAVLPIRSRYRSPDE
jgi:hypothetical protein